MKQNKLWNKDYILLLQGMGISQFGDILYSLAISYYVYDKTGSTLLMALIASISMMTRTVMLPFAGAIVDRLNRKKIIVSMDLIRGAIMLLFAYLSFNDHLSTTMIMICSFICATCNTLFSPAVNTILVDILKKKTLIQGQSIYNGTQSTIDLIGNSLSGAIVAMFGITPIILLNGISFIISAITEYFIDVPIIKKQGDLSVKTIVKDVLYGGKLSINLPVLKRFMLTSILLNLLGSGMQNMLLPISLSKGLSLNEYGVFLSAISAIGIIASFMMGMIKIKSSFKFNFMIYMFILSNVLIIGSMSISTKWFFACFFILSIFSKILANSIFNASFMISIPKENRGTIFGFMASCGSLGAALSTMIYGFLGEYTSLSWVSILGSSLTILVFIAFKLTKTEEILAIFSTL
ncbi:MAG: MFS transporter [Turicibacter sp.]